MDDDGWAAASAAAAATPPSLLPLWPPMDPSSSDPADAMAFEATAARRPSAHGHGQPPDPDLHLRAAMLQPPLAFFADAQYLDTSAHHLGLSQYYAVVRVPPSHTYLPAPPDAAVESAESSPPDPSGLSYICSSPCSSTRDPVTPAAHPFPDEAPELWYQPGPRRRRENRYRNAPPGVLSRRRAQNRASQRAYRERKEQRIRDLEQLLHEATQRKQSLSQAYMALQAENASLRAGHETDNASSSQSPGQSQMAVEAPSPFDVQLSDEASDAAGDSALPIDLSGFPQQFQGFAAQGQFFD